MPFKFKKDFIFGVATSATQIEGGDTNNTWFKWTKNHDKTLDKSDPLLANSHWENYKDHIDLMSSLSISSYRMSLEWSRIEPEEGQFSLENMNHYIDEIKYLKSKGISVIITLHHFAEPIWFDEKGGFKNRKYCIERFKKYTTFVTEQLNGLVNDYCTINEPNVYALLNYQIGGWVHEEKSWRTTKKVLINLGLCHIEAYKIIHEIIKGANVGFALNVTHYIPLRKNNIFDKLGTWFLDKRYHLCISNLMCYGQKTFPLGYSKKKGVYFDYFGVNYYTTNTIKGLATLFPEVEEYNDLGWAITPNGFRQSLQRIYCLFHKKIYVLENGIADKDDKKRVKYIYDHLNAIHDLDFVDRYYHWTFMDNFEWKDGYLPRFGLIEYHYNDKTYTPRNSAYFYKEIIMNNGVNIEMKHKFKI